MLHRLAALLYQAIAIRIFRGLPDAPKCLKSGFCNGIFAVGAEITTSWCSSPSVPKISRLTRTPFLPVNLELRGSRHPGNPQGVIWSVSAFCSVYTIDAFLLVRRRHFPLDHTLKGAVAAADGEGRLANNSMIGSFSPPPREWRCPWIRSDTDANPAFSGDKVVEKELDNATEKSVNAMLVERGERCR